MTAIVRATYRLETNGELSLPNDHPLLAQGAMSAELFHDDDDDFVGECSYPGDFAEFKSNAEVLFRGSCYTPNQQPMTECPVRFSVGRWSKILRVIGRRVFHGGIVGATTTDPIPFTRMPITYSHAYGGPEYALNPVGKGYKSLELPNLELPGENITSPRDRVRPAGFGPISPFWSERKAKLGQKPSSAQSVAYPEDFDVRFFQSAPADQQLAGYLVGNEEVVLHNLHPAASVLTTRLPGLKVRVFVGDIASQFREIPMVLDTLFVDTDLSTLTLTYRGSTPAREVDLTDIQFALIDAEKMGDRPKSLDHYRSLAKEREADPYQIQDRVPEELQKEAFEVLHHRRLFAPETTPTQSDPLSNLIRSKLGHLAPTAQERVREAVAKVLATRSAASVDYQVEFEKALKIAQSAVPPAAPAVPGVVSIADARTHAALRKVRALVEKLKNDASKKNISLQGLEAVDSLLNQSSLAGQDRTVKPIEPGVDLAGHDLSGQDLSGRDLQGANLTGAILAGTNLHRANLRGASLKQAVLSHANLTDADCSSTNLTQVNANGAKFTGTNLRYATMDQAQLEGAEFVGADLSETKGKLVIFTKANLNQVKAVGASFEKSMFHETSLVRADFTRSTLIGCFFGGGELSGCRFDGATLTKTSFANANIEGASFVEAKGDGAIFMGANVRESDFSFVFFDKVFVSGANLTNVRLYGANLRDGQFIRTMMDRVDAISTNLAGANFSSANVKDTQFSGANLFEACFSKTTLVRCSFASANLKRSTLEGKP